VIPLDKLDSLALIQRKSIFGVGSSFRIIAVHADTRVRDD
jgi:hypothetical protein